MNASPSITFPKSRGHLWFALLPAVLVAVANAQTPIAPSELEAPKFEISDGRMSLRVEPSALGRRYLTGPPFGINHIGFRLAQGRL